MEIEMGAGFVRHQDVNLFIFKYFMEPLRTELQYLLHIQGFVQPAADQMEALHVAVQDIETLLYYHLLFRGITLDEVQFAVVFLKPVSTPADVISKQGHGHGS